MATTAEFLVKEASNLPYAERAKLVDTLLTTLDPVAESDCDTAWYAEIARREQELASGSAATFSWDEVKRQAQERVNG
jgi:putative addiction module component (TIGR02574 family)